MSVGSGPDAGGVLIVCGGGGGHGSRPGIGVGPALPPGLGRPGGGLGPAPGRMPGDGGEGVGDGSPPPECACDGSGGPADPRPSCGGGDTSSESCPCPDENDPEICPPDDHRHRRAGCIIRAMCDYDPETQEGGGWVSVTPLFQSVTATIKITYEGGGVYSDVVYIGEGDTGGAGASGPAISYSVDLVYEDGTEDGETAGF